MGGDKRKEMSSGGGIGDEASSDELSMEFLEVTDCCCRGGEERDGIPVVVGDSCDLCQRRR